MRSHGSWRASCCSPTPGRAWRHSLWCWCQPKASPQLAATSIGLATLAVEIFGATAAPIIGGALAEKHGLATPLWMSAGETVLIFLVALLLENAHMRTARLAHAAAD